MPPADMTSKLLHAVVRSKQKTTAALATQQQPREEMSHKDVHTVCPLEHPLPIS